MHGIQSQFHHAPVDVPKHTNPFPENENSTRFNKLLLVCIEQNIQPIGDNIREDEWNDEGYPTIEVLQSGRHGIKEQRIALPIEHWLPRAQLWVQALVVMKEMLN